MSLVRYDLALGAARITLTVPDRGNPLDLETAGELLRAVRRARADDARVVVLRGQGRAFSFGGDVEAFAAAGDPEQLVDDWRRRCTGPSAICTAWTLSSCPLCTGWRPAPACHWPRPRTWSWPAHRRASPSPKPRSD
jgi:hypothetical protein